MNNPWLWWLPSGVAQDYHPFTTWFSPRIDLNFAGDRKIESHVIEEVASYGKQLGVLMDVVSGLAQGKKGSPEFLDAVHQLENLKAAIETVKNQHKADSETEARKALADLRSSDPAAYGRVVRQEYNSLEKP